MTSTNGLSGDNEVEIEEDTYSSIFQALKHPIRRRILRMLDEHPYSYTEILNELAIDNGLLNYHLDNLRELLAKGADDKYELSEFGEAALTLIRKVEEPTSGKDASKAPSTSQLIIALVVGLLVVCVTLTSYMMVDAGTQLVKGYETTDYGDTWYPQRGLYGLESWEDHPGTLMNFWWNMNTTVDVYVMSREQYLSQKDTGFHPEQYSQHYVGRTGNITVMVESNNINYQFAMYTGNSGVWEDGHGFSISRWKPIKTVNNGLLVVNILLTLSTIFLAISETSFWSRLASAITHKQRS